MPSNAPYDTAGPDEGCVVPAETQQTAGPAKPPTLFEEPLVEQIRSITVKHGQPEYIVWQMHSADGFKLGLTGYSRAALRILDASAPAGPGCGVPIEFIAIVTDQANGVVTTQIGDPKLIQYPGIYEAEVAVLDDDGGIVATNDFYLVFERSLFALTGTSGVGPLTIAEIRLQLRDSSRNQNLMLNSQFFTDSEIISAIVRPVDYWNEALPPVAEFSVATFPFRENWRRAATAILFEMAEESYRRNALAIQQGGLSIDETQKFQWYQAKGAQMWQDWKDWVRGKKLSINLGGGIDSVYSQYIWGSWW